MSKLPVRDIAALALIISLLFLPVAMLKENRISKGIAVSARNITGIPGAALFVAFVLLWAFSAYLGKIGFKVGADAVRLVFAIVPAVLVCLINRFAGAHSYGESSRISLSAGFFLSSVGFIMLGCGRKSQIVAFALLAASLAAVVATDNADMISLYKEYMNRRATFTLEIGNHLKLALLSAAAAVVPGVLLGYVCYINPKLKRVIIGFVNLMQVLPTLSLLGLIMLPLSAISRAVPLLSRIGIRGIGFAPTFIALWLYCLLPITLNTIAGFMSLDQRTLFSARAMGMTKRQILMQVEIPLSFPVVFSGIRTAITQNVGNATIAGLVGGGGMGTLIFLGLSQAAPDLVLLGSLPVILLALLIDAVLVSAEGKIRRAVTHTQ